MNNQNYSYSQKILAKRSKKQKTNPTVTSSQSKTKGTNGGQIGVIKSSLEGAPAQMLENLVHIKSIEDVISMSASQNHHANMSP